MLAEILAMPDAQAPTALRAWLLAGAAIFCEGERRPVAARRLSDQALAIARTGNDVAQLAAVLQNSGLLSELLGDLDGARASAEEARELFRRSGDRRREAPQLTNLGRLAWKHDGVIYLVNMWTSDGTPTPSPGSVVRYDARRGTASEVAHDLNYPNMLAVGQDHTLYVSANSVCPATGGASSVCWLMGETSGVLLKLALPAARV